MKYYSNGNRVFRTDHADYLYTWLEQFLKNNEWKTDYVQEYARSVVTTICLIEDIDVDTMPWDRMMWDLFNDCNIGEQIEVADNEIDEDEGETRESVAFDRFDLIMGELFVLIG